jgi:transketolase
LLLIATGTELPLAVEAYEKLTAEGHKVRVVSLPSWELFEQQSKDYQASVIPPTVTKRICIEMGSVFGWERFAGPTGTVIGMRSFGASAPLKDLAKHFGFTLDKVLEAAKAQLSS